MYLYSNSKVLGLCYSSFCSPSSVAPTRTRFRRAGKKFLGNCSASPPFRSWSINSLAGFPHALTQIRPFSKIISNRSRHLKSKIHWKCKHTFNPHSKELVQPFRLRFVYWAGITTQTRMDSFWLWAKAVISGEMWYSKLDAAHLAQ